jgi:4-hydroxythreonine-4-phosphate dehydrogenase
MKPVIAITVGDYNGIGPEVTLRCLASASLRRVCSPVLVGPVSIFEYYARRFQIPLSFHEWDPTLGAPGPGETIPVLVPRQSGRFAVNPGKLSARAGTTALRSLYAAVRLIQDGWADALVTAPVSKKALHLAGSQMPGQTELLQRLTSARAVAMLLVSDAMKVALTTIHLPLRRVARSLTGKLLESRLCVLRRSLRTDWGIKNPRIAVLGLNPHAGEDGDIGDEEQRIIIPTLRALQSDEFRVEGPFPADGFFGSYRQEHWDAVLAMYHDQGLVPLKYSSFGGAVNYTAGLPIIRTSPDHGTAFDIAGQGIANTGSMAAAINLSLAILRTRTRTSNRTS